jgi:hypothetical protein
MKYYTLIIAVFISIMANSQQKEIPYINSQNIKGLYNSGADAFALVFSENRTLDHKDIYQISFLNNDFEKVFFEIEEKSQLIDVVSFEGSSTFAFINSISNKVEIIKLSKSHVISHVFTPNQTEKEIFSHVSKVEINEIGNIFVFRSYSIWELNEKNVKITIERGTDILSYNPSLELIGTYRMKNDTKIRSNITGFTPIKEGFILLVETKEYKERKYDLNLQIFTNELTLNGVYVLTENESFFPTEIISDRDQIVIAGYSIKGSIFDSKGVEGLFVSTLNMDGTLKKTNKYSWEMFKSLIKDTDKGDFIFNGKMNVLVEKIIPSNMGYQIICESYANNSGNTTLEFALIGDGNDKRMIVVHDFVIFNSSLTGGLIDVKILEKDPVNIEINGSRLSKSSKIELAYNMKKYKAFPFRNLTGNLITFVNYKNKIGYISTIDVKTGVVVQGDPIVITPIIIEEVNEATNEFVNNSGALSSLNNLDKKINNTTGKLDALGNKLDYSIGKVDLVFNPWANRNVGMFSFDDNTNIGFVIAPNRHSIFFEAVK